MVYQAGDMLLQEVQKQYQGKVNDVMVCQDLASDTQPFYTVLIIKERDIAKKLLAIYDMAGKESRDTYICNLTWQDKFLMVFPYNKERQVEKFLLSDVQKLSECETLCMNIVMECIAARIPYPILYLQLAQEQLHVQRDGSVYFGYNLNMENLRMDIGEKECATLCAKIVFELLDSVSNTKTVSYKLLERKNTRGGYFRFADLYKDIKTTAVSTERVGIFEKLRLMFYRNQDKMFRILLVISIVVGMIALLMLVSQIVFADIPFLRIFINTFKMIGTESLLQ